MASSTPSSIVDFAALVDKRSSPFASPAPAKPMATDTLSVIGEETASAILTETTSTVVARTRAALQATAATSAERGTSMSHGDPRSSFTGDLPTRVRSTHSTETAREEATPLPPYSQPSFVPKPLLSSDAAGSASASTIAASDPNLLTASSSSSSSLRLSGSHLSGTTAEGLMASDPDLIESANAQLRQGSALLMTDAHSARQNLKGAKAAAMAVSQHQGPMGIRRFRLLTRTSLSLALCSRDRARHFAEAHHFNSHARSLAERGSSQAANSGDGRQSGLAAADLAKVLLDESEIWLQEGHHQSRQQPSSNSNGGGDGGRRNSHGSAHSHPSSSGDGQQHASASSPPSAAVQSSKSEAVRLRARAYRACEAAVTATSGYCYTVDEYNVLAQALVGCGRLMPSKHGQGGGDGDEDHEMRAYYYAQARDAILQARLLPFPDRRDAEALIATERELKALSEEENRRVKRRP